MDFNRDELQRYARHFSVKRIGLEGQALLREARVLCVGGGGIGSPALLYLAAGGVGTLGVVDDDQVELSNLQRQVLYVADEIGQSKVDAAQKHLKALNNQINIKTHHARLTFDNIQSIIQDYDIVLDGSDNYETRYLVNAHCAALNKILVSASIFQFSGQVGVFNAEKSACYRCLYPDAPAPSLIPNCAEAGVLGVVPGVLGSLATLEVMKIILKLSGEDVFGRVLVFDGLNSTLKSRVINKRSDCIACVTHQESKTKPQSKKQEKNTMAEIKANELRELLASKANLLLVDVREPWEVQVSNIEGSINIPLGEVEQAEIDWPKDQKVVVYCQHGVRSLTGQALIQKQGYQDVLSLKGGIAEYLGLE